MCVCVCGGGGGGGGGGGEVHMLVGKRVLSSCDTIGQSVVHFIYHMVACNDITQKHLVIIDQLDLVEEDDQIIDFFF